MKSTFRMLLSMLLVGLIAMGLASSAKASTVLFSDLSPTDTYDGSNVLLNIFSLAASFTPSQTLPLDSVDLALTKTTFLNLGVDDVAVYLYSSGASGKPDVQLEFLGVLSGFPVGPTDSILQTATSTQNTLLQAGTEYFVVVSPAFSTGTDAAWHLNSDGLNLPFFLTYEYEGAFVNNGALDHPAFRVNGVSVVNGVAPLPAAVWPALVVMVGAGLASRVRRRIQ